MLYIGEQVGRLDRARAAAARGHRGRSARGDEPRGHRPGRRDHGAGGVGGGRPHPRAGHVPREAVPSARSPRAAWTSRQPAAENLPPDRRGAAAHGSSDITVIILDRPRHDGADRRACAQTGARIKLISDGDVSAAISCAVQGTGVHAVMGIGGAPEGVITAAALRCLGGEIQARFRFRNDEERERGAHDAGPRRRRRASTAPRTWRLATNLVFAATGVTGGRPAPGRPLLRRRGTDAVAGDGLPGEAGALRGHRPHVRPGPAARRPPVTAATRSPRLGARVDKVGGGCCWDTSGPARISMV